MKQPLIIREKDRIIISHNGRKLIKPIDKHQDMTDEQLVQHYITTRNIKNNDRV